MTERIAVEVPTLDDLAPALRRCAEPEVTDEGEQPALLRDAELRDGPAPHEPGIYVWSAPRGAVVYIGRAAGRKHPGDLAKRLNDELSWVEDYDPRGNDWKASFVHVVSSHQARPRWARATSNEAAVEAERRLIEWHRARVGIGPVAVGWDAKANSPQGRARAWARALWDETIAGSAADSRVR